MNRVRIMLGFIFGGGLLIFASPYLIYEAAVKHLPWSLAIITIPFYLLIFYGAFEVHWPRIKKMNYID